MLVSPKHFSQCSIFFSTSSLIKYFMSLRGHKRGTIYSVVPAKTSRKRSKSKIRGIIYAREAGRILIERGERGFARRNDSSFLRTASRGGSLRRGVVRRGRLLPTGSGHGPNVSVPLTVCDWHATTVDYRALPRRHDFPLTRTRWRSH